MNVGPWPRDTPGLLRLPSGRAVRGRGVWSPFPEGARPTFGLYLLDEPHETRWASHWLHWPDFGLPADDRRAREAFVQAWERAEHERVELACGGGHGRTGTALACVAVLDGVPAPEAVAFVREHYRRRAVETPDQHEYVRRFR